MDDGPGRHVAFSDLVMPLADGPTRRRRSSAGCTIKRGTDAKSGTKSCLDGHTALSTSSCGTLPNDSMHYHVASHPADASAACRIRSSDHQHTIEKSRSHTYTAMQGSGLGCESPSSPVVKRPGATGPARTWILVTGRCSKVKGSKWIWACTIGTRSLPQHIVSPEATDLVGSLRVQLQSPCRLAECKARQHTLTWISLRCMHRLQVMISAIGQASRHAMCTSRSSLIAMKRNGRRFCCSVVRQSSGKTVACLPYITESAMAKTRKVERVQNGVNRRGERIRRRSRYCYWVEAESW
ncbi:hypothetical protein F4780DRAFT_443757 [Xylariomycetidae sp. FL0641]|nr:hypothetical protein F4780DRAFT_443757 [Xylariomycetidae sp. FL0641]